MPQHLRFQPEPWMTHMVTTRCLEGRPLLCPSERTNQIVTGCFAYSLRRFQGRVALHHIATMSNHYHTLLSAEDQPTLSAFMSHLNGCLGKELGVINDVHGHIWHRRYAKHLLLDEEALVDAYKYLFANSVKEGLVEHPRDWPGVHGWAALCDGRALEGIWVDRTALSAARRRAASKGLPPPDEDDFTERLTLTLTPPPLWELQHPDELKERYATWADEVASRYAEARLLTGERVMGAERVMAQDRAQRRPLRSSPRPLCRAGCPARFGAFWAAYRAFAALYREASALLRAGLARSGVSPRVSFPGGGVPIGGGFFEKAATL